MTAKIHRLREHAWGGVHALSWCGLRSIPDDRMVEQWAEVTCHNCLATADNMGKLQARHRMWALAGRVPNDRSPQTVEAWLNA